MATFKDALETFTGNDGTNEQPVLERMNRVAGLYLLSKGFYSLGQSWYKSAKAKMTYRVAVYGSDELYDDLHAWLLNAAPQNRQRSWIAHSKEIKQETAYPDDSFGDSDSQPKPKKRKKKNGIRLAYGGGLANNVIIDGHRVSVSIEKPSTPSGDPDKWARLLRDLECMSFVAHSPEGRDAVKAMLEKMWQDKQKVPKKASRIRIVNRWGSGWNYRNDLPGRPLSSVILPADQIERVQADVTDFLRKERQYTQRAIPWHRGYLFHGPPGTGKTSLAWGLADHFKMDLWYMPLGGIDKDGDLLDLVSSVQPRSILLLEDIDVFSVAKDRDDDSGRATLSGLLNALDGVMTPHGVVTIMTTNDLSVLDPALIRPGRADVIERIDLLNEEQAARLLQLYYPSLDPSEAGDAARCCVDRAPSTLAGICKRFIGDELGALKAIREEFVTV